MDVCNNCIITDIWYTQKIIFIIRFMEFILKRKKEKKLLGHFENKMSKQDPQQWRWWNFFCVVEHSFFLHHKKWFYFLLVEKWDAYNIFIIRTSRFHCSYFFLENQMLCSYKNDIIIMFISSYIIIKFSVTDMFFKL